MFRSCLVVAALVFTGCAEDPFFLEAKSVAVCQHLPAQRFQVPSELREQYARLPPAMQQFPLANEPARPSIDRLPVSAVARF